MGAEIVTITKSGNKLNQLKLRTRMSMALRLFGVPVGAAPVTWQLTQHRIIIKEIGFGNFTVDGSFSSLNKFSQWLPARAKLINESTMQEYGVDLAQLFELEERLGGTHVLPWVKLIAVVVGPRTLRYIFRNFDWHLEQ